MIIRFVTKPISTATFYSVSPLSEVALDASKLRWFFAEVINCRDKIRTMRTQFSPFFYRRLDLISSALADNCTPILFSPRSCPLPFGVCRWSRSLLQSPGRYGAFARPTAPHSEVETRHYSPNDRVTHEGERQSPLGQNRR